VVLRSAPSVRPGGAGGCSEERPWCSGLRRWCRAKCRWGSEELRGTPVGADASKPRGAFSPPPEGGGSSGPWSGSPRPRGGLGRRAVGRASGALPKKRSGGPGGARLAGATSPKSGGGAGCVRGSGPPRGVGLTSAPGGFVGRLGQAPSDPSAAGLRPSEEGRARASRKCLLLAGRAPGCSAEAGRSGSASAPMKPRLRWGVCGVRVGFAGAEAPVSASAGGPSVGGPSPEGVGCPVRLGVSFSRWPEGFWVPAWPKPGWADTVCRSLLSARRLGESLLRRG
jgi:hypothetical protein